MENGIDITIPTSKKVLNTNIVEIFNRNNLAILAPNFDISKTLFDKVFVKKLLYKLKIPTSKFGIFEKQNMAIDYIKNIKTPFVIKTKENSSAVILTTQNSAKIILDSAFAQKEQKVLIEDYVWGTPFSFYVITDGYKALPIGSSILYKHVLDGDGGQLTSGMGACSPNYKLTYENEEFLMNKVIYPIIEHFEREGTPYLGFLSVNCILTEENDIQVLGFKPFMQDADTSAVLNLLDIDLLSLIDSCLVGAFSDEVEYIPQKDLTATSLVLTCRNKENIENSINGVDNLDDTLSVDFYPSVIKNKYLEFEAKTGPVLVLTAYGSTITSAKSKVYEEAETISFNGLWYRKDICKPLISEALH
jgi:phosphoribosylamine--glycine ligase